MTGKRIRYFRGRKDLTQKELGGLIGFSESTAEVRIAQYERGRRKPKQELINKMAEVLDVNPHALMVPDLNTPVGVIHTMFALEDEYGMRIVSKASDSEMDRLLEAYEYMRFFYTIGQISKEAYDKWRYNFDGDIE